MKVVKNHILRLADKKPILLDIFHINPKKPLVVFAHGYKGFKDWGAWDLVADAFTKSDINLLKFNFSHNGGTVENPIDFPDPEAFAQNTYSFELEDLDRVLNFIMGPSFQKEFPVSEIILMGHSRGGGVSIIKAAEDKRIKKVITWASVSDFRPRFMENTPAFEVWKKTGITYIENSRTKQMLPHYFSFYEDFMENRERFSIERASRHLKKPILIVHGTADSTVPIEEAKKLFEWNGEYAELFLIPDADHVFGTSHPWSSEELPAHLSLAVKKTIDFIKTV